MYSSFQLAKKYWQYYRKASSGKGHGMHSPFVFDFISHVLHNNKNYAPPSQIEALRQRLLSDKTVLTIEDLGAGSRKPSSQKTVSRIAATAIKPKKYGQLLYRLARHYQPHTMIELGTSLGITAAYLSTANPDGKLWTIEGSAGIHRVAGENLQSLHCDNVTALQGSFDDVLADLLARHSSIDLAYIDGNHRYEPTMRYFQQLLQKKNTASILVFDDIHWSQEMEQAWNEIKTHPAVHYTIDIFFLGFVFFRDEFKVKQDFIIRF